MKPIFKSERCFTWRIRSPRIACPADKFDHRGQRYQVNGGQDPRSGRVEAIEKRIEIKVDCDHSSRACCTLIRSSRERLKSRYCLQPRRCRPYDNIMSAAASCLSILFCNSASAALAVYTSVFLLGGRHVCRYVQIGCFVSRVLLTVIDRLTLIVTPILIREVCSFFDWEPFLWTDLTLMEP